MTRPPPRQTLPDTLFPYTAPFRSYDWPLTAGIEGLALPVSHWVRTSPEAKSVARDGAEAITASMSGAGQIATLILPANTAWNEAEGTVRMPAVPTLPTVGQDAVRAAAASLRSAGAAGMRAEERRVGKEGGRTCRTRWWPYH